ncbi:MAG: hypothetical protein GY842_23780, partial [bacterium]|nr:hypothetical protein [bacterium]
MNTAKIVLAAASVLWVSAGTALAGEAQSIHTVARAGQVEQVRTMLERSPE